jgi:hypothetical protein
MRVMLWAWEIAAAHKGASHTDGGLAAGTDFAVAEAGVVLDGSVDVVEAHAGAGDASGSAADSGPPSWGCGRVF